MILNKKDNEKLLIKGMIQGNHACFKQLFEMYSPVLYSFSYNYLKSKDEAEDVVQETFVKVWNRKAQINVSGSFKSYLITIALNLIRQHFNSISKDNELRDDLLIELSDESTKYSEESRFEELVSKLEMLIKQMPPKRQLVFHKNKIEGSTAKDIARELNITVKTVEYHVSEAMKFLKKEFECIGTNFLDLFCLFRKFKLNNPIS